MTATENGQALWIRAPLAVFSEDDARGGVVVCGVYESGAVDPSPKYIDEGVTGFEGESLHEANLSSSRTWDVAAGETITYVLACAEIVDGGEVLGPAMTALFTPNP